jgi:uncharacterized protein YcbX
MARLARIVIYPIKSLDGVAVEQARVLPSGALEHDRRWALVDSQGKWVNGKRTPRIHRLRSTIDAVARKIVLIAGGKTGEFAIDAERAQLEQWLSNFLGMTVRIEENAVAGSPDDTTAPGPTVVSTATLAAVSGWFPGLALPETRRRFRANLEIKDVEPFWEDRLYAEEGEAVRFQIGKVLLEGTYPCQRCVVPTRSPETGERYDEFAAIFEKQRHETLPWWATRARFDHFYRLAVNTRPVTGHTGMIRVGDEVKIIA